MKEQIGDGSDKSQLCDLFLSNAPNDAMSGQAYEGFHFVHYGLERTIDSVKDVLAMMEDG